MSTANGQSIPENAVISWFESPASSETGEVLQRRDSAKGGTCALIFSLLLSYITRGEMTSIARLFAVIAAVLLVIGAAVFLFFRSSIASEGLYRVQTAVGLDAAAPERHVVPAGFQGWAVVHYGVEGVAPLRHEGEALILEYPATGRLVTSSPAPEDKGFLHRGYYTRTADGLAPLSRVGDIWGEFSHIHFPDDGSGTISRSSGFFVGSMKEFMATDWPVEHRLPGGVRK
jgi:hypothetical protein